MTFRWFLVTNLFSSCEFRISGRHEYVCQFALWFYFIFFWEEGVFRETRSPEILDQRSLRSKRFTVKKIRFSFCDDEFLSVSLRFCVTPTWNTIHTYTYLIQFIFLFDCISMLFSFDHLFILLLDRVTFFGVLKSQFNVHYPMKMMKQWTND